MLKKLVYSLAIAGAGLATGHLLNLLHRQEQKQKEPVFDVQVGDAIQWESKGAFIFPEPKVVKSITENYVFVEGAKTGVPTEQVVVIRRAES